MKFKIFCLACLSLVTIIPAFSQVKSVTNAELEKFRQKRLQAEKDYRENYAKMGFPSPEELDRQIEKSRVEREALAARLTAERLQREQLEAERAEAEAVRYSEQGYLVSGNSPSTIPAYYYNYPNSYYYRSRFPRGSRIYNYPVSVGNGIPIVNYYGQPGIRVPNFQTPNPRWRRP